MFRNLSLVLSCECAFACRYCPVEKSPRRMPKTIAQRALDLFAPHGLRRVRFAGGDPLHARDLIDSLLSRPDPIRYRLTTNGLLLDRALIERLQADGRIDLVLSVDGDRVAQEAGRRTLSENGDVFGWFERLSGPLSRFPGVTVNMVVTPETVARMVENVAFLNARGFFRLNLLPAYYIRWQKAAISELERQFRRLAAFIDEGRRRGLPFEIVNLEQRSETALYRGEIVVDTDGYVYDSDIVTARIFANDRQRFALGHIEHVGDPRDLLDLPRPDWQGLLAARLGADVMAATAAVDAALTRFVERVASI